MFTRPVQTAFSSDIADELFPHIKGESYHDDRSFVGTARAVLTPHLTADFKGCISIEHVCIPDNFDEGGMFVISSFAPDDRRDILRIFDLSGVDNTGGGRGPALIESVAQYDPAYQYDEKLFVFFEQSIKVMKCWAFVNKELHNTMVFVESLNTQKLHALQSMLPRLMPWWWNGESPSEDERTLFKSLCSRFPDKVQSGSADNIVVTDGYTKLMQAYEPMYDFKGAKIRKLLPEFLKKVSEGELDRITNQMLDIDNRIDSYEREITSLNTNRRDLEIRMIGLKTKSESDTDTGLVDYFLSNPSVDLVDVRDSQLRFCVYTTLDWWNEESAPYLVDNRNSDMYTKTGGIRKDDYAKLLRAVFVDRTMQLRVCAAYSMNVSDGSMRGVSGYNAFKDDSYIPNAHIQVHGCTGDYRQQFRDAMRNGDYILAVDIAITSAKSLNFGDISFSEMMTFVGEAKDRKVFQDLDGHQYTAIEAVRRIKAIEKEASK